MLIHGDCKDILPTLNTKVDLIYLDPPFNTGRDFVEFDDRFKDGYIDDNFKWIINNHSKDMAIYITFLYERLILAYDLLKDTGSLYLHCDPTASHYIKMMMDGIFSKSNFRNEIVWFYPDAPGRSKRYFPKKHDVILFYSKEYNNYYFNDLDIRIPILDESKERYKTVRKLGGRAYIGGESSQIGKIPESVWRMPVIKGNSKEKLGYPTQKPLKLLERIIKASSKEGDTVLDPFCGSGTTLVAAKNLNRNYIGIDINKNAIDLCNKRLSVDNLQ